MRPLVPVFQVTDGFLCLPLIWTSPRESAANLPSSIYSELCASVHECGQTSLQVAAVIKAERILERMHAPLQQLNGVVFKQAHPQKAYFDIC